MKAFLNLLACLMTCLISLSVSLSVQAREFVRVEERCQIYGYQEDIDTPRFKLPKTIELSYKYTYAKDTLELVRKEFSLIPDSTSKIPPSSSIQDSLLFDVKAGKSPKSDQLHFSALLKQEDLVHLIQHLASDDTLQFQDPLEVEDTLSFQGGFDQFLYPQGYFFNFLYGFRFQAHLPLTTKNGLSYHIVVTPCERDRETPTLFSLRRPGSGTSFATGSFEIDKRYGGDRTTSCQKSVAIASESCQNRVASKVVHQRWEQKYRADKSPYIWCHSIVMCESTTGLSSLEFQPRSLSHR